MSHSGGKTARGGGKKKDEKRGDTETRAYFFNPPTMCSSIECLPPFVRVRDLNSMFFGFFISCRGSKETRHECFEQ